MAVNSKRIAASLSRFSVNPTTKGLRIMASSLMRLSAFRFQLLVAASLFNLSALVSNMALGQTTTSPQKALDSPLAYDVVSVKPDKGKGPYSAWARTNADGFSANLTVRNFVSNAYGLFMEDQIAGLPEWANTAQYEIQAKLDPDRVEAYEKLCREERGKQDAAMLQALLADRFRLKVRHELKPLPVYELVVAKGGPKLTESPPGASAGYGMSMGAGHISGHGMEIPSLSVSLSGVAGRLILDKTGLTGKYEVELNWSREDRPGATTSGHAIFCRSSRATAPAIRVL